MNARTIGLFAGTLSATALLALVMRRQRELHRERAQRTVWAAPQEIGAALARRLQEWRKDREAHAHTEHRINAFRRHLANT